MSIVARCACASTFGQSRKSAEMTAAARTPNAARAHAKTTPAAASPKATAAQRARAISAR
jgi:hypothetical protein